MPSAASCWAADMTCGWLSRLIWFPSPRRPGRRRFRTGPDLQAVLDSHRDFWTHFFRNFWKVRELIRLRREVVEPFHQCWKDIIATLTSLADGADLLFTGVNFEDAAGNVAEYYDIPLATLHLFPLRANGLLRAVPACAVGPFQR